MKPRVDNFRIKQLDPLHIGDIIRLGEATRLSPWTAQGYLDELKNPDSILLRIVTEDNETGGFVVGRCVPGGEIEKRTDAEIYNIAVRPDLRGTGCGQKLFDAFCETCRARKVANFWLEVRESNLAAIRFYERNGFRRVATRKHFYDEPREHALLMRLELDSTI